MELPGAMMPVLPNPSVTLESGFAREVSKQSLPVPNSEQPAAGSWMLILVKSSFFWLALLFVKIFLGGYDGK